MTYGFYSTPKCCQGMERQDVAFAIIDAFTEWENAVPKLNFQWLYPGDDADIRIRFTSLSPPYYGFGYYPPDGRLLLDISRTLWSTSSNPVPYKLDLQSESMHEIGHTLGLEHTNDPASVMYPTLSSSTIKRELTQLDINNIRALYRSKPHHELANSI
ncbi:hypothetical protein F3Y22_tig00112614pilonHSYRG00100 [Hibiscus syriacus]|uniref:Peptidase metallopeptidase domain-containing protein n=1 Tax=Hibiscus syriacus TaxID=106335 RepID=A0A6A2XTY9_HIBSY|nr:hypothetical protein F3Y22_tig00112614pilonHSYRG00100 [Hibiscus syriacus]